MKNGRWKNQWLLYGSGLDWQLGAVLVFWLLIEAVTAVALAVTGEKTTVIFSAMICLLRKATSACLAAKATRSPSGRLSKGCLLLPLPSTSSAEG